MSTQRHPDFKWEDHFPPPIAKLLYDVETSNERAGHTTTDSDRYKLAGIAITMVLCQEREAAERLGGVLQIAGAARVDVNAGLEYETSFIVNSGDPTVFQRTWEYERPHVRGALETIYNEAPQLQNLPNLAVSLQNLPADHPLKPMAGAQNLQDLLQASFAYIEQKGNAVLNARDEKGIEAFSELHTFQQALSGFLNEYLKDQTPTIAAALQNYAYYGDLAAPRREGDLVMIHLEEEMKHVLIGSNEQVGHHKTHGWRDGMGVDEFRTRPESLSGEGVNPLQAIIDYNNTIAAQDRLATSMGLTSARNLSADDPRSGGGSDHSHRGTYLILDDGTRINAYDPNKSGQLSNIGEALTRADVEASHDLAGLLLHGNENIRVIAVSNQRTNRGTAAGGEFTLVRPVGGVYSQHRGQDDSNFDLHDELRDPRSLIKGHNKQIDNIFTQMAALTDVIFYPERDRPDRLPVYDAGLNPDEQLVERITGSERLFNCLGGWQSEQKREYAIRGMHCLAEEVAKLKGVEHSRSDLSSNFRTPQYVTLASDSSDQAVSTAVTSINEFLGVVAEWSAYRGGILQEDDIDRLNVAFLQKAAPALANLGVLSGNIRQGYTVNSPDDMTMIQDNIRESIIMNSVQRSDSLAQQYTSQIATLTR